MAPLDGVTTRRPNEAAKAEHVDAIVTRDVKHFRKAEVPVWLPAEAVVRVTKPPLDPDRPST